MSEELGRPTSRVRELSLGGAHLLGLSGLAFAQPLYDLFQGDLSALVATDATGLALVLLVAAIALGPPLALLAVEAAASAVSRGAARTLHLTFVGGLVALLVLQANVSVDLPEAVLVALAALLGVGGALLYRRSHALRFGLTVLSPAPLLFAALFLTSPAVSTLLWPDEPRVAPAGTGRAAPVVLVVFDELPLASLLDRRARIDRARYPAFARLAGDGTWFPNTTSVDGATPWAVPAILTGNYPDAQLLATSDAHPHSIFTLLGGDHETRALEPLTRVCPQSLCRREQKSAPERALGAGNLLTNASANRLLPERLGKAALRVTRRVQTFLGVDTSGDYLAASVRDRRADFQRFAGSIRAERRARLYMLHVLLPHGPWEFLPSGRRYRAEVRGLVDGRWVDDPVLVAQGWQRHLLQLEYTDRLLGSLLRDLDRQGLYEEALIAVVADHGVNFAPGGSRREVDRLSARQLAPVPFILKAPGRRRGAVDPEPLETVDVLPTIADALGRRLPWRTDGSSAFRRDRPHPRSARMTEHGEDQVTVPRSLLRPDGKTLARRLALFGSGGDRGPLFTLGAWAQLVGRRLPGRPLESHPSVRVQLSAPAVPAAVEGTIEGASSRRHRDLAIAVNDRIAAVTSSFRLDGAERFAAVLPDWALRPGANHVAVLSVRRRDERPVLARLAAGP